MLPKVAIITLNWNGWQDTLACLESIHQIDYENYDTILVDNASTDESLTKIDAYCRNKLKFVSRTTEHVLRDKPTKIVHYHTACAETEVGPNREILCEPPNQALTVIQNGQNYGFAEGNNIAVAYALNALSPEYVLLVNNDTVVDKNFLDELVNAAEHDGQVGLLQPKILRSIDSTIESTGIMCDPLMSPTFRGAHEKDEGQYDNDSEYGFFYASGACLLIRKSLLAALSGECFDPHLFAYYEDVDLSWTARLIGFKVVYCPESVCYHKRSATFGSETPLAVYLTNRNRIRVMIKNYSLRTLVFVLPLTIVLRFSLLMFDCIVNYDSSYLVSFLRALYWNVLNLRNALVLRERAQSKRKLRDHEIIRYMTPYSFGVRSALKRQWRRTKE
jgi:GT2 family glycosyltransferase